MTREALAEEFAQKVVDYFEAQMEDIKEQINGGEAIAASEIAIHVAMTLQVHIMCKILKLGVSGGDVEQDMISSFVRSISNDLVKAIEQNIDGYERVGVH